MRSITRFVSSVCLLGGVIALGGCGSGSNALIGSWHYDHIKAQSKAAQMGTSLALSGLKKVTITFKPGKEVLTGPNGNSSSLPATYTVDSSKHTVKVTAKKNGTSQSRVFHVEPSNPKQIYAVRNMGMGPIKVYFARGSAS